jgi:opacity protein-like surface antigen
VGTTTRYELRSKSFSETVSVGAGFGYRFNSWFRVDLTGELRAGGRLRAMDYVEFGGGSTMTNTYDGGVRSWAALANFYVDLGTFCTLGCLTPYLGAGFGFASHTVSGFTDVSAGVGSLGGYAATTTRTSFAWALMAGVGYKVNDRLTLELGYRYLNLGDLPMLALRDPATGLPPASNDAVRARNLTAHEIRVGMRWSLNCSCAMPAEPIVARY